MTAPVAADAIAASFETVTMSGPWQPDRHAAPGLCCSLRSRRSSALVFAAAGQSCESFLKRNQMRTRRIFTESDGVDNRSNPLHEGEL